MLVTLSSYGQSDPSNFRILLKEGMEIAPDSRVALVSAFLNKKREIDIPRNSSISVTINDTEEYDVSIASGTYTDGDYLATLIQNRLNIHQGQTEIPMVFTVKYLTTTNAFQIGWTAQSSITLDLLFISDLNYALGYAESSYSHTGQGFAISSELAPNSTENKNALMIHISPLQLHSYNTRIGTYQSILATIPASVTGKTSVLNYSPPNLFYLPVRNKIAERIYHFDVSIRYPDGSLVGSDLVADSTIVINLE